MKDFALKLMVLITSAAMLYPIYIQFEAQTILEVIGLLAIFILPYRFITRMSYKFWTEL